MNGLLLKMWTIATSSHLYLLGQKKRVFATKMKKTNWDTQIFAGKNHILNLYYSFLLSVLRADKEKAAKPDQNMCEAAFRPSTYLRRCCVLAVSMAFFRAENAVLPVERAANLTALLMHCIFYTRFKALRFALIINCFRTGKEGLHPPANWIAHFPLFQRSGFYC